MQQSNIPLQVRLSLLQNPLLEEDEVKGVRVLDSLGLQPFDEEWKVVVNLLPIEYSIDHMTAEQPHLYLIPRMRVDLRILMDRLEYVRRGRPVRELQFIEAGLSHCLPIPLLEVLDRHLLDHTGYRVVGIIEQLL